MSFRIAYLTSQYPAASHTFIRREIAALRELGWLIDTFSVRAAPQGDPAMDDGSGEVFCVLRQGLDAFVGAQLATLFSSPGAYFRTLRLALRHRAPGFRGLLLGLAHFAEAVVLARELRKRGIGHLHNHFANSAATVGLLAKRLLGIRWSFTMHGISETDYPAGLLLGRKIEFASFVACASWFMRAQGLRLVAPAQWEKMHVVRCGLRFAELPQPEKWNAAGQTIICVGRLSPEKGQSGLIRAFASVRSRYGEAQLRLVGDGPDRKALERLAAELEIANSVTFCGALNERETLAEVARADILALPSFMEGLPVVLMEAMALGVPVVASRVAGIPELVDDGVNGLLFAPSDWDQLGSCLDRLMSDPSLGRTYAERAKAAVRSHFDIDDSARQLASLFEEAKRAR